MFFVGKWGEYPLDLHSRPASDAEPGALPFKILNQRRYLSLLAELSQPGSCHMLFENPKWLIR